MNGAPRCPRCRRELRVRANYPDYRCDECGEYYGADADTGKPKKLHQRTKAALEALGARW